MLDWHPCSSLILDLLYVYVYVYICVCILYVCVCVCMLYVYAQVQLTHYSIVRSHVGMALRMIAGKWDGCGL